MKTSPLKSAAALRLIIFAIGTLLIVYFMPRTSQSTYIYEQDRPWNYSLLTAPFDIPVYKDSLSVRHARDSVDRAFVPVFKRKAGVDSRVAEDLSAALAELGDITPDRRKRIVSKVREVFASGVVDESVYNDIVTGRLPNVRFATGDNLSAPASTSRLRSPMRAYEWIKEQLPDAESHRAIESSRLASMLEPNMVEDSETSERILRQEYQKVSVPVGVLQQGERIIDRGDIVSPRLYTVLRTFEQMQAERGADAAGSRAWTWMAKFLYVILLFSCMAGFLHFFRPRIEADVKAVCFLVGIVTIFALLADALGGAFTSGLYIVPFTMVPIMVLVFFDGRTAMFTLLVTVLACAVSASYPLEFIFMQFVAGVTAINSLKELSRRSQLLRSAVLVFVAYSLAYVAVNLMTTGSFNSLTGRIFGFCAINAVFVSFAYVLIFVVERLFGFTSLVALVELSDINNPVLRELSKECPGTFQHSMAVSNLASEAALKLGANVQLVRAGALYHDIGKISNPAFFTENQHGVNPHDALDPEQSARIIVGHVTDGLKRADKARLPQVISNFIAEHHGRGTARFFYLTACRQHPDEYVDPAPYTYPGPNPRSVETSILMMADAVEAASRSLKDYSAESIDALVDKIIDTQVAEGLHNESPLAFRDVKLIKETFASRLRTIYHSRIAYPDTK
ncbi:MAG: HDIG domain-containing protein [Muribaculaceae bacterium]|nr:HDIG domain-containing protein [Muribaculaceae bacterium]MDE5959154.1 HDIG domain-containing protein [Muribaculaceae bacterium]MDE5972162.1 HDIG domain-containing protein [Muribaculaceae bacterium]